MKYASALQNSIKGHAFKKMDFSLFGLQFFDQCMVDLQTKAIDELLKVKRIKKIVSSTVLKFK